MLRFMYKNQINVQYIPEIMVKMRIGGQSNRSLSNRLRAHLEDKEAWRINNLSAYFFTVVFKPLRKIGQYILKP